MFETIKKLDGSYALAVISTKEPDKIICARNESPLVLGIGKNAVYCASDMTAFLPLTNKTVFVNDGELVILTAKGYEIRRIHDSSIVNREPKVIDWTPEMAIKQGYPHFMIKEIHEQPSTLRNTLRMQEHYLDLISTFLDRAQEVYLVACGTSYHACLAASYMFSKLAFLPTYPVYASEFVEQHGKSVNIESTILAVSQSGETADTLRRSHMCTTTRRHNTWTNQRYRIYLNACFTSLCGSTIWSRNRSGSNKNLHVTAFRDGAACTQTRQENEARFHKTKWTDLAEKLEKLPDTVETIINTTREKDQANCPEVQRSRNLLLPRSRDKHCHSFRGQTQTHGNCLCSRHSLPSRRKQARSHQPNRTWFPVVFIAAKTTLTRHSLAT